MYVYKIKVNSTYQHYIPPTPLRFGFTQTGPSWKLITQSEDNLAQTFEEVSGQPIHLTKARTEVIQKIKKDRKRPAMFLQLLAHPLERCTIV